MREICFINKGDNIKKLCFKLGVGDEIDVKPNLLFNYRYGVLKEGREDIQIVKNYNPYFISKCDSVENIECKGYKIVGVCSNKVLYYKPSGIKYSVKPLETIEDISEKFDVDTDIIMSTNNLITPKLFVGQILYL